MYPRTYIEAAEGARNEVKEVIEKLDPSKNDVWTQKAIRILTLQDSILTKEIAAKIKLDDYTNVIISVLKKLEKLDKSMHSWEKVVKESTGKGLTAFLNAAQPIGIEINDNWLELVDARDEQKKCGAINCPSVDAYVEIKNEIRNKINPLFNEFINYAPERYARIVEFIKTSHRALIGVIDSCIKTVENLNIPQKPGSRISDYYDDPDTFIQQYGDEIDFLNAMFDKLIDAEKEEQSEIISEFSEKVKNLRVDDSAFSVINTLVVENHSVTKTPSITDSPVSSIKSRSDSDSPACEDDGYVSASSSHSDFESTHTSSPSTSPVRPLPFESLSKSSTQLMFKTAEAQKQSGVSAALPVHSIVTPAITAPAATLRK